MRPDRSDPDLETLLSGVQVRLRVLENEIRLRGCRIDQMDHLAAVREALTRASRAVIAEHTRHRIERAARPRDAAGAEAVADEIATLVHRFNR